MWKNKFKKEREEIETMENLNRVLLENVLPAHVAEHFLARSLKNEVSWGRGRAGLGQTGWRGCSSKSILMVLETLVRGSHLLLKSKHGVASLSERFAPQSWKVPDACHITALNASPEWSLSSPQPGKGPPC